MTDSQHKRWLISLLVVGCAARVFGAWCYKYTHNLDFQTVAMMVKHMVEGTDYPVFFYGQSYMGSLEPMMSAVLCKIFGYSPFMVCMGTAVFGMALLPLIYCWGRDVGGKVCGLTALALMIVGPEGYFHYMASARGGYTVTLLFGAFIVWFSCRMIQRQRVGEDSRAKDYLLLGVVAGLGWWSNGLIVYSIGTAALLFVLILRQKVFHWHLLVGAAGFVFGCLPWLIWNLANGMDSLGQASSLGETHAVEGLLLFWGPLMLKFLYVDGAPLALQVLTLGIYAGGVLTFLFWAFRSPKESTVYRLSLVLYVGVACVLFSTAAYAQMGTPRYHLPLYPVLAIMLGYATTMWLKGSRPSALALLPVLALIGSHSRGLPERATYSIAGAEEWASATAVEDALSRVGTDVAFADWRVRWLNLALDERVCVFEPTAMIYKPYAVRAEMASRPAILDSAWHANRFVYVSGGTSVVENVLDYSLAHSIVAPSSLGSPIERDGIIAISDDRGRDVHAVLRDQKVDTAWRQALNSSDSSLAINLDRIRPVSGLRVTNFKGEYPYFCEVWWRTRDGNDWIRVAGEQRLTRYFWSGPRFFAGGSSMRAEIRFAPVEAAQILLKFRQVRNTHTDEYEHLPWEFGELDLLAPGSSSVDWNLEAETVHAFLVSSECRMVYADRWLANTLSKRSGGELKTSQDPRVFGDDAVLPAVMALSKNVALVVLTDDRALTDRALAGRGVRMASHEVGAHTVYTFGDDTWLDEFGSVQSLYWKGYCAMMANDKHQSLRLFQQAEAAKEGALALMEAAWRTYPGHRDALGAYIRLREKAGQEEGLSDLRSRFDAMWTPRVGGRVEFSNGATLLGVTLGEGDLRVGGHLTIKGYWRCDPETDHENFVVFVHLLKGKVQFAADHTLLDGYEVENQPFSEVFVKEVHVPIPIGAEPGEYSLRVGIYPSGKIDRNDRVSGKSELEDEHSAFMLPLTVVVPSS